MSEENLDLVRSLPCAVCSKRPVDPHHIKTKGAGGKDTLENLLSLCRMHHRQIHAMGRKTFFTKYIQRINAHRLGYELPLIMEDQYE